MKLSKKGFFNKCAEKIKITIHKNEKKMKRRDLDLTAYKN